MSCSAPKPLSLLRHTRAGTDALLERILRRLRQGPQGTDRVRMIAAPDVSGATCLKWTRDAVPHALYRARNGHVYYHLVRRDLDGSELSVWHDLGLSGWLAG
jgi:hypothetical protein